MKRKWILTLLILAVFVFPTTVLAAKDYTARAYDVEIEVLSGGDLLVTETVQFQFMGGPFSFVFRTIEGDYMDAFSNVQAAMDGVPMPPGDGPGQVEIEQGNDLSVTWHFNELSDQTHTFTLQYVAEGVVRRTAGADLLEWNALPTEHEYFIQESTVTVYYPDDLRLAGQPYVARGIASIETGASSVTFYSTNIESDEPLHIGLEFPSGSLVTQPPEWQVRSEQTSAIIRQMLPWGAALGLGILITGVLAFIFWRARANENRGDRLTPAMDRMASPPNDRPPAVAGLLAARSENPGWQQAMGTLLDLSRRGWLRIEERPKHFLSGNKFQIVYTADQNQPVDATLLEHERALLSLLFESKKGRRSKVDEGQLASAVSSELKRFSEPLKEELVSQGLVNADRRQTRNSMNSVGVILIIGSVVLDIIGFVMLAISANAQNWGIYRLMILLPAAGAGFFLLGMAGVMFGGTFSPFSNSGEYEAEQWRAFSRYLKDVTSGKEPPVRPDLFEHYLPYAAAFGLAEKWAKFFQKQGRTEVPGWFRPLASQPADAQYASFVAVIAATNSTGTSASGGGAGGGGAAGGGASGAG
jgi:hypothetical protein